MNKKLYVPESMARKPKDMENISTPIKTAFGKDKRKKQERK